MTEFQAIAPEFGQLALILALVVAVFQVIVPLVGVTARREWLMAYARPLATGQALFLVVSLVALTYSFVIDDFSEIGRASCRERVYAPV